MQSQIQEYKLQNSKLSKQNEKLLELSKSEELSQTKEKNQQLEKELAECRAKLESEKKNIKTKTVEKKLYFPKCANCSKDLLDKAKSGYETLKNGYIGYLYLLGAYAIYLTFFQILRAEYFKRSLIELLFGIQKIGTWLQSIAIQIEPSPYYVVNVLIRLIVWVLALGIGGCFIYLIFKFYSNEYFWHWGTALEVFVSIFLIINLDKWIYSWWHKNLFLLFFMVHSVYLIIIFCVRKKMDS